MEKDVKIKDKNRSTNRVVVIILLGIVILFILIRVVALNASSEGGITVIQPDLDSVNLENNTSKIAKFEKEQEEEEARKNNYTTTDPQPSNYNFKEMFGVDSKTTSANTNTIAVENKEIKEDIKPKSNSNYGRYQPVVNEQENYVASQKNAKVKQEPKVEVVTRPEPEEDNSSPFGTYSSNKKASIQSSGSNSKVKDAYKCFLHSDQKLVNGGGVIFRAGEDIILSDRTIKKNSILYGSSIYQGQRIMIKINRVKSPEGEYSVNLIVYDNDFVKGIFFKNAYDEVAEKTTDDVANDGVEINPSLLKTGAKAVIHAGKNVGDAIKKERALHLQEGYIIYIKEPRQNENN